MVAHQTSTLEDDEYARVVPDGLVPPGLADQLTLGVEGFVRKDGKIALDSVSGLHLKLKDTDAIEPRTDVYVTRRRGKEWAIPLELHERKQYEKKAQNRLDERKHQKRKERRKREAEEFWQQYDIPIEYGTAIKLRMSGLRRGSWGDGRAADTVQHLHVKEDFKEGRLERSANSYLCEKDSHVTEQSTEKQLDSEQDLERKVTCETCLDRMERWKVGDE